MRTSFNFNQILPGLFQGSAPPRGSAIRALGFDRVVLCAYEYQPKDIQDVRVQLCPLDDSSSMSFEEARRARDCGDSVARGIRRGEKILVTCFAGLNRSGLVSALAVRELTGVSGIEAVRKVQRAREGALSNDHFVQVLSCLPSKQVIRLRFEDEEYWNSLRHNAIYPHVR